MNFSLRLMEAMALRGIKQKELASLANVPQGAISNYCNDKALPNAEGLYKISKALSVSMEWLMGDDIKNHNSDNDGYWKTRAIQAETKLRIAVSSLEGALKSIRQDVK